MYHMKYIQIRWCGIILNLPGDRYVTAQLKIISSRNRLEFFLVVWFILGYSWVTGIAMFEPELSEIGVCFV